MYKFVVPEAHFNADAIGAGPAVIAHRMVKLVKILYLPTQCGTTVA